MKYEDIDESKLRSIRSNVNHESLPLHVVYRKSEEAQADFQYVLECLKAAQYEVEVLKRLRYDDKDKLMSLESEIGTAFAKFVLAVRP